MYILLLLFYVLQIEINIHIGTARKSGFHGHDHYEIAELALVETSALQIQFSRTTLRLDAFETRRTRSSYCDGAPPRPCDGRPRAPWSAWYALTHNALVLGLECRVCRTRRLPEREDGFIVGGCVLA